MISIRDNGFGKRTIFDPSPFGPLILEDAGTVAHVYWNGSALVDTRGNAWVQNGTVPQVGRAGRRPAGAGPFSVANYYNLPSTNPLQFAATFSVYVVGSISTLANYELGVSQVASATANGWGCHVDSTGAVSLGAGTLNTAAQDLAAVTAGPINVVCLGWDGANWRLKVNLRAMVSGAAPAYTAAATSPARIGLRIDSAVTSSNTTLYEVVGTTTSPSDALFTAVATRVKARLGITAW